jgi:glyoxylase-like metal-dependent hydrolase (beta-lactamase superfamily II)
MPTQLSLYPFRPHLWLTERQLADFDVRGAVIVGEQRAVVWDTLAHPSDMRPVLPVLAGRPLTIVYSHADWDHVWGTGELLPLAPTIVGHSACLARFAADVPATLREKQQAEPGAWDAVVLVPPSETFQATLTLDLGGVTLELYALPGHTLDCIVGFVPEWGILLAGDTVETPLPVVNPESPLDPWLTALRQWERDGRVQTVIPAHGAIGGPELLRSTIQYLEALQAGHTEAPLETLPEFYRETHALNVSYIQPKQGR